MKVIEKIIKQSFEELKELNKDEDFREIVDKIPDVLFVLDKDLRYTYWNQAASELVGIKENEMLGKSILDILPDNEKTQKEINVYKNVLKTKQSQTFTNEYQTNGENLIFEISAYPSLSGLIAFARDITDRKKTEETIFRLEKELDAMYKNVPVMLLLVDEERRVRKANAAALKFARRIEGEITGVRGGEALGCLYSLADPKGCGFSLNCKICGVRNTVLDTFKTGKPHYHAEAELPFKIDGKKTILSLLVNTVPIEHEGKRMVLVSMDNITELKKSEEEVKNLSKIQEALIDNIPVLEYNVSPGGKILDCNKLTLKTLGYSSKGQLIGKPIITTVYPQASQEKAKKLFLKWKKQGWLKNEETRIVTKKGKILDVILNVNTLYDNEGKVLSTISTQLDITDRKKAEEDLEKAYLELDRIFNTSGDGMRLIDKNYNVLKVNRQFCKLSKFSQKENLKKKCYEAFPGPSCHKPSCSLKQVLSGIDNIEKEEIMKRADNKEIPVLVSVNPLKNVERRTIGVVINYKDISERRKSEQEIKSLAKFPSENPNPVGRIDFEGKILYGNKACKLKLKEWKCRIGGDVPLPIRNIINKMSAEKSFNTKSIDISMGDRIYEFTIAPVVEAGYVNIYGRDITDRKKAESELKSSYSKLQKILNDTINSLASIVEKRDPYTSSHQKRVTLLAIAISEELGLDKDRIEGLSTASRIHDIGKITVPASILSKPEIISSIEYDLIKAHPLSGYNMIKEIEFPWPVADIILQHHERLNGSGYPNGLNSKDMMLEAKILAVADVVEAMATHRPYRPALGMKKALEEIKKGKKKLYDSRVVDACIKIITEKKFKV